MASTSSQTPSSSTLISTTPTTWDVFLSFRGEDTRRGFTSHLYSALTRYNIQTFMDDPELSCGEEISAALIKAIQGSKIYVVVFSENYASSGWCLNELIEILNCNKTMQRLVIPVFYNIDPTVVRYQTGSFEEHFRRHEIRYTGEMERVNNWRLALKQVADNSGKHVDGKRSEADIVNEIVDEILLQIKPTALHVAEYPVGLDSRVEVITKDITARLSSGTEGVIKIGLYGMGGVGKTTLAKALFNKLLSGSFKGSCFLANVRENLGNSKGLESLQQQLINDVLKSKNKVEVNSVDQGIKLIDQRICSTNILVVIDDLEGHEEFKSLVRPFSHGSVVIITTRNKEILDTIEVESQYRINVLGDVESRILFSRHAFGHIEPPNNTLMVLSKHVLLLAGGLPLALKIFGSYLYNKSVVRWESYIEKLQRNPDSSIHQKLAISLDALESDDPLLKKMFLDIACFFFGRNKKKVVEILDTYYPYADDKIDILRKRCLLTINNRDELGMHDLLLDMGKEIARNNSPNEPGKHSRLWVRKEICDVLREDKVITSKGTETIEGIMLRCFEPKDPFKEVTLKGMSKLRFLYFNDINLTGKFKRTLELGVLEDLRWFCWQCCPLKCLPFDFCPQKLVTLELRYSKMTTMWEVNMVSNVMEKLKTLNMCFTQDLTATPDFRRLTFLENLKTLDMSYSKYLTTTPDFRRLPCLENLNLLCCTSLKEVHISIGSLVSLVSLDLTGCVNLRSLPDTICKLKALEVLSISYCNLRALPDNLGNIKSLTELNAGGLSIQKLPDSIGDLNKLVTLSLHANWKLKSLPNTICNLKALKDLSLNGCTLLEALPDELGNIESLRMLHAEHLALLKLPDSIGDLSKLVNLKLDSNKKLESLPNTICNLRALEVLSISNCTNVEALPDELGNIESLRELRAERTAISKLPDSICNMRSLEILEIRVCHELERLPDQLWKLTRLWELKAGGALLKQLPDIESGQTALPLRELDLYGSKITALPSGISQLSNLECLNLNGCGHLLFIADLPPNLRRIYARDCTSLERVNVSNLKLLKELNLRGCSALTEILGLGELASLRCLDLKGCHSSLVALDLKGCHFSLAALFQIYSGFEDEVGISLEAEKFPAWIIQSCVGGSKSNVNESLSVNLRPNLSHNYLGMVLCFEMREKVKRDRPYYSVMTSASNIFEGEVTLLHGSGIVIVPRSIFTVTDGDHTIKFTSNARRHWIHLMYKNDDVNCK